MKKLLPIASFALVMILVFSCKNDDDSPEMMIPEEEEMEMLVLPEATQTGAGTFGALVDGEVFSEDDTPFNTVYSEFSGDFFFVTGAFRTGSIIRQIRVGSEAAPIEEGMTYELGVGSLGTYYGEVLYNGNDLPKTTAMMGGELTITKLDPVNLIVSGTFWFDIEDLNGNTVEIREGRFDQTYMN